MMWRYISRRLGWEEDGGGGGGTKKSSRGRARERVRTCVSLRWRSTGISRQSGLVQHGGAVISDASWWNAIAHDDALTRVTRNYALMLTCVRVERVRRASPTSRLSGACQATRVFRKTWRKQHSGAHRDAMATSSCRVHALPCHGGGERARARAHAAIHLHNAIADARAARFFALSVARFRTGSVATPRC